MEDCVTRLVSLCLVGCFLGLVPSLTCSILGFALGLARSFLGLVFSHLRFDANGFGCGLGCFLCGAKLAF